MDPRLPVTRASEVLMSFVKEKISMKKVESLAQAIPSIEMMQQIFPDWTFKTCRLTHPNFDYISSNCNQLFGYKKNIMGQMDQRELYKYVPEEDCEDLYNSLLFLQNFYSGVNPAEFHNMRFTMQYRFVRGDGKIITLRDEKATLHLNNDNRLYYAVYKDVTNEVPFNGVKLVVYSNLTGEKITEYRRTGPEPTLSGREGELLLLIRSGLSTKEMAWQMNISHHTVRNIRQRMFEKFKVSNSIELINRTQAIL